MPGSILVGFAALAQALQQPLLHSGKATSGALFGVFSSTSPTRHTGLPFSTLGTMGMQSACSLVLMASAMAFSASGYLPVWQTLISCASLDTDWANLLRRSCGLPMMVLSVTL